MKKRTKKKYSYIRLPYSQSGWFSFILGLLVASVTVAIMITAVRSEGKVPFVMAAAGVSAVLLGVMGVVFSLLGIFEKEHNHLFAVIGGVLSVCTLAAWVLILMF